MPYETSYDVGLKPFSHDKNRGKWASSTDFLFVCIGHAFKFDAMFLLPMMLLQDAGLFVLIPYFIIMVICTMPIVFMQSFLGQFSSTGFISVFRIAPIFKGIGYVSLAINLTTLTYYSIFAAIPLFYFFHSLRPTLPWSCEGAAHWMEHNENKTMPCNLTNIKIDEDDFVALELPSLDFFRTHLNIVDWEHQKFPKVTYSWSLILCTFIVWSFVLLVLRKPTPMIGRIIRYSTIVMISLLSVCVFRFMFLPGAFMGLTTFLIFSFHHFFQIAELTVAIPLMALSVLGPGWGSILTMASYNNFKTDITKYSWILCLGHLALMVLTSLSCIFIENFLISSNPDSLYIRRADSQWMQLVSVPTALSLLEMPNLWSLVFFGMIAIGATNLLIVQLFSVMTALFDEFEQLRRMKKDLIRITVAVLALVSALFCSNYGVIAFELMTKYSVLTQIFLNLMLLLVVLWIYGRERFQRDLYFMTSRTYYTWMVNIVRFVAPIFLLLSFFIGLAIVIFVGDYTIDLFIVVSFVILLPWLLIPGYCIFRIMQTSGFMVMRFKRCIRPADWYPADPVDRQRYEETFNNPEISHQLTATEDDA